MFISIYIIPNWYASALRKGRKKKSNYLSIYIFTTFPSLVLVYLGRKGKDCKKKRGGGVLLCVLSQCSIQVIIRIDYTL